MSTEEESSETESAFLPLRPALGPPDFRTVLALAMVVVAVLGAIVADHTASVELTSATNERRLDQGQMLELQYRQTQLDLGEKRKEFDRRRGELVSEATLANEAAEQAREKGDLRAAAALELRAQESSLRARIYRLFSRVLPDMGDNTGLLEDTERPHLAAVSAACAQSLSAGDLVWKAWATRSGWVHVALIFADALPADQACDVARSIYDI